MSKCTWGAQSNWSNFSKESVRCTNKQALGSDYCEEHREQQLAKVRALPPPRRSHKLRWPTALT